MRFTMFCPPGGSAHALVINILALSRLCYVTSFTAVPDWVNAELLKLIFKFFWAGDLIAPVAVMQPPSAGGSSTVDPCLKVVSLLVQWVQRLVISPNSWTSFMSYWRSVRLSFSVWDVLSFPPFYHVLLIAWRSVGGSWSPGHGFFLPASSSPFHVTLASKISAQPAYRFLLSENRLSPHCVLKFFPVYGCLYWPSTWCQLYLFPLDHLVLDLSWEVAHCVLYTAGRLLGFG